MLAFTISARSQLLILLVEILWPRTSSKTLDSVTTKRGLSPRKRERKERKANYGGRNLERIPT